MAETRNTPSRRMVEQARFVNTFGTAQTDTEPAKITYRPQPGDPKEIEAYGRKFKAGEAVEVPGRFVDKAKGNPSFDVAGEKKDRDADKADPVEQEPATFEENLARERTAEYLENRQQFGAAPPGEAERVARAQEQAAELRAAVESDDKDEDEDQTTRRKRGRPRSD